MSRKQQKEISEANQDDLGAKVTEPKTPQEMRRKGNFLVRQFSNPQGPLLTPGGKSTVLGLSAIKWGEAAPKNSAAAHLLAKKGEKLIAKADHDSKKS
jgi:hypothetical protein